MSIFKTVSAPKLRFIFISVALLLFVVSGAWGFFSGVAYGRSMATYKSASAIYQALKYYYSDQGRYPSEDQYANKKILKVFYLNDMPKPDDANGICQSNQDFIYRQANPQSFALTFCLTQGVNGLSEGVHTVTEKGTY